MSDEFLTTIVSGLTRRSKKQPLSDLEREFLLAIAHGLECALAVSMARKWIKANFEPSTRPHKVSLYGLKNRFTHRYYLKSHSMQRAFEDCGIKVVGQEVFAKERKCTSAKRVSEKYILATRIPFSAKTAKR
jgi:hypothetical protein